ncbi:hypothetical protein QYF36_019908 [Acer negundo]|nr:hypothetical protein QYF36_019908 [Acer negundo]
MEFRQLYQQLVTMRRTLVDEGVLDGFFLELENLHGYEYVEETFNIFINKSTEHITTIEQELEKNPIDHKKLDNSLNQLKGSSDSANASLQELKKELDTLKEKMNAYFEPNCGVLARMTGSGRWFDYQFPQLPERVSMPIKTMWPCGSDWFGSSRSDNPILQQSKYDPIGRKITTWPTTAVCWFGVSVTNKKSEIES